MRSATVSRTGLDLSAIDGVVSDMDGVTWRGTETLPGVTDFFEALSRRGTPFVFATNNSGKEAEEYANRFRSLGLSGVTEHQVVTSGTVTAEVLARQHPSGTPVHVLGSAALEGVLRRAGFDVLEPTGDRAAEVVVVGIDRDLTYDKLERAMRFILEGAAFYGTNGDVSLPTARGFAPGAGSILAALAAATGRAPTVIGKPEPHMYQSAIERLGTAPERTVMIGDRLDTDILGAQRFGMQAALLLTGVETQASAEAGGMASGTVFAGLPDLLAAWSEATRVA